jgi:predicted RND superfamily exporter protein
MATKITAAMLIATALPISKAFGHTVDKTGAPVTGYLCVMLGIGAAYALFLVFRMFRKKQENQNS